MKADEPQKQEPTKPQVAADPQPRPPWPERPEPKGPPPPQAASKQQRASLTDRYEAQYVAGQGRALAQQEHRMFGGEGDVPESSVGLYRIYDRAEDAYVVIPAMWSNHDAHLIAWAMNFGAARQRLRKSRDG